MIFVLRNLTYDGMLVMMHEIFCIDPNSYVYKLRFLLNTNNKITRFKIKNHGDVQYVLGEGNRIPKVYVTI